MTATTPTYGQTVEYHPKRSPGKLITNIIGKILFFLVIAFILIYTLFPFIWAIISSLSPDAQLGRTPVKYWPEEIDWSHYKFVLDNGDFLRALRNSVIVSVARLPPAPIVTGTPATRHGDAAPSGVCLQKTVVASSSYWPSASPVVSTSTEKPGGETASPGRAANSMAPLPGSVSMTIHPPARRSLDQPSIGATVIVCV